MCVGDGSVMDVRIKNEHCTWDMEMNMDSRTRSFFSSNENGLFFRKS